MGKPMTRRQVLVSGVKMAAVLAPTPFLFGCGGKGEVQVTAPTAPTLINQDLPVAGLDTRLHQELITSSKAASSSGIWTELQFNDFIDSMGEDSLKRTSKTLAISPASVANYVSNPIMKREIKKAIVNASSGIFGRDADKILYHEKVVVPTAHNVDVASDAIETYDTLSLERAVYNKVLERNWTNLNENERINFLEQASWNIDKKQALSLAALTGSGFLMALSTTVNLAGFSFYTGMSSGLYAIASSMGIVLPFSLYTGASSAIALATGPVGWVAAAVLAAAGIYAWLVKDKETKEAIMLKTVLHMHHYKISAMQEANLTFSLKGV